MTEPELFVIWAITFIVTTAAAHFYYHMDSSGGEQCRVDQRNVQKKPVGSLTSYARRAIVKLSTWKRIIIP